MSYDISLSLTPLSMTISRVHPYCWKWHYFIIFNGWVIFQCRYACACALSHVQLFATPWTVPHQAPLSMGLSRQEYQSGLPFPSPVYVCIHININKLNKNTYTWAISNWYCWTFQFNVTLICLVLVLSFFFCIFPFLKKNSTFCSLTYFSVEF